jgi:hypothetical protein
MPKAKTTGTQIDSPFTAMRGNPSLTEAPGCYDHHPNVGPAGDDGGLPLKFFDHSIPGTKMQPEGPSMTVVPAKTRES